ncbi:MAG: hypothetical protein QXD41_03565 [Nitrososphaeria archaeon]
MIPKRNTRRRLREIIKTSKRFRFPVFCGTENNTKRVEPLVNKFILDPEFLPVFRQGAYLILGHQFLSKYGGKGYVNRKGRLTFENREAGTKLFSFAGRITWSDDALKWLSSIGKRNVYRIVCGLGNILDKNEKTQYFVKPSFRIPRSLLDEIEIKNSDVVFTDMKTLVTFEKIVRKHIVPM